MPKRTGEAAKGVRDRKPQHYDKACVDLTQRPKQRWHTEEEIEAALVEFAKTGMASRASRNLKEMGITVTAKTLKNWADNTHHERYVELRNEYVAIVRAKLAHRFEDGALLSIDAHRLATERLIEEVPNLPPEKLSTAARDMAVSAGVMNDKSNVNRGMPDRIVERREPEAILKRLSQLLPDVIDAEAVEVTDE